MEFERDGRQVPFWEPLSWEISSNLFVLLLIPVAVFVHDRWIARFNFKTRVLLHALLTIPFSLVHVAGMVAMRHFWYWLMSSHYVFGDIPTELFYEYRKDAQAYALLMGVVFAYRFIVCRLQGEASYLSDGDESENQSKEPALPPQRLLIKKMGREFLIQVRNIEWIEASGNYANLHLKNSVYPMRITMDKLEKLLPSQFVRIHRSSIVNLEQIEEIQPLETGDYQMTLHGKKTLLLSRRYREGFKSMMSLS
jgi:hypothetical protein